jgi:hypothetical protein
MRANPFSEDHDQAILTESHLDQRVRYLEECGRYEGLSRAPTFQQLLWAADSGAKVNATESCQGQHCREDTRDPSEFLSTRRPSWTPPA